MLSKEDQRELWQQLRADKVLRVNTFLTSHRLTAGSVVDRDGSTVLHAVCRAAAENVYWIVARNAPVTAYLAKDRHGRTPLHYAAVCLLKTGKMSVFNNIIQPMIEACPGCLHTPDGGGRVPLQILAKHPLAADMLRAQLAQSAPHATNAANDSWHDKIWAEMQFENAQFDKYDDDFGGRLSDDPETTEARTERLAGEHSTKKHANSKKRHSSKKSVPPVRPEPRPSLPSDRREQERQERRKQEEQERQRRFQEQERLRQQEEAARRRAREQASQRRLNETPPHSNGKASKRLRRYRTLHKLVHGGDERLTVTDFKPLKDVQLADLRQMVGSGGADAAERRRAVRDLLRLWHPDKCMAKIQRRFAGNFEQVNSIIVGFVQLINRLL